MGILFNPGQTHPKLGIGALNMNIIGVKELLSKTVSTFFRSASLYAGIIFATIFFLVITSTVMKFIDITLGAYSPVYIITGFCFTVLFYFILFLDSFAVMLSLHQGKIGIRDLLPLYKHALSNWKRVLGLAAVAIVLAVVLGLGYVLFVIPGIILTVWFFLTPIVFVIEDVSIFRAFMKSKEYVKGHWGKIAWRLLSLLLVNLGLFVMVMLVAVVEGSLKTLMGYPYFFATIIAVTLWSFWVYLINPIFVLIVGYHLYESVKKAE